MLIARPSRRRPSHFRRRRGGSRQRGFTLTELLITLFVVAEILVAASLLFDVHNELARVQTNVANMQQSLRGAQRDMVAKVRMAGRGGVPAQLPTGPSGGQPISRGVAVSVTNNVGANVRIVPADTETAVVPGTDILRVRGIFENPIYQVVSTALGASASLTLLPDDESPATATSGTLQINNPSPTGVPQDLEALAPLGVTPNPNLQRALMLVSPLDDTIYAVVPITNIASVRSAVTGQLTQVTLTFATTSGTHNTSFRTLFTSSGNLPNNLTGVAFAGLLEEHVYYVREVRAIPGDATSELTPKLSRAELFPGTNVPLSVERGKIDVADNVIDFQVALGFNSSLQGYFDQSQLEQLVITETADGQNDDWLYNSTADADSSSPWVGPWAPVPGTPMPELNYVRLSTLARTDRRDFQYISPPIGAIEDRVYGESATPGSDAERRDRMFRRRLLQTVVDLRNL